MNNYRILLVMVLCIIELVVVSCAVETRPDASAQTDDQALRSAPTGEDSSRQKVSLTLTVPLLSDFFSNTPVALVNDEPVMLSELRKEISSFHGEMMKEDTERGKAGSSVEENYMELLNRVINARLIVEEAKNMGLDEIPSIQEQIKETRGKTLRQMLFKHHLDSVEVEVPEDEVTAIFKSKVKEYKMSTLLFKAKEDADRALEEILSGKDYDAVGKQFIEEGKAEGSEKGGTYVKAKDLLPHVAEIIRTMDPGEASPVIKVPNGKLAIFKYDDIRYPDDREELARAREMVLTVSRNTEVVDFMSDLVKKYVTVDEKLIKKLDFDDKEAFRGFLEDNRVVATVEGEAPVTVKDLATALNETLFHGPENVTDLNKRKRTVLDNMLKKMVLKKEALSLGLDKTDDYKEKLITFERGLLFGKFIEKVVAPDAKLSHAEVKGYYDEHKNEFLTPEMMRIDGRLVFTNRQQAEDAAVKLRAGTDIKWILENAEGQVDKEPGKLMNFEGRVWSVTGLPEDVQKVVESSREGEIRIYESPEGDDYVLIITDVISPRPRPFDDVKLEIAKELHGKKVAKLVKEWAGKLRDVYPVEIYINTNN